MRDEPSRPLTVIYQSLREQIERLPDVIEAQLISREQALSELQEQSGLGEALKEL
ncbi:permease-like cell division protein FtsX, partial [Acinetobacter bereziniae]|uniref:permease-like cell division protein FtsX n=1 Tax=Acinetobacter bereziniae TaxID=106648 RepID=UPI0039C0777F